MEKIKRYKFEDRKPQIGTYIHLWPDDTYMLPVVALVLDEIMVNHHVAVKYTSDCYAWAEIPSFEDHVEPDHKTFQTTGYNFTAVTVTERDDSTYKMDLVGSGEFDNWDMIQLLENLHKMLRPDLQKPKE